MRKFSLITAIMFAFGLFMVPTAFATSDKSMDDKKQSQSQQQHNKMKQNSQNGQQFQKQAKNLMQVDHLIGTNVMNQDQKQIGEIDRVLVDIEKGKVAYVVISGGGILGVGDNLYIVPFNALKREPGAGEQFVTDRKIEQTAFSIDMKQEKLKNVPDGDLEEALNQRSKGEEIHKYYDVTPYWEDSESNYERKDREMQQKDREMQQKDREKECEDKYKYDKNDKYHKNDKY